MSPTVRDRSSPAPHASHVTRLRDDEGAPVTREAIERLRRPGTDPRGTMVTVKETRRRAPARPPAKRRAARRPRPKPEPTISEERKAVVDSLAVYREDLLAEVQALSNKLGVLRQIIETMESGEAG